MIGGYVPFTISSKMILMRIFRQHSEPAVVRHSIPIVGDVSMGWLRKLVDARLIKRSSKDEEELTPDECRILFQTRACPDCGGTLAAGPSGCAAQNFCCVVCHSEFNLTWLEKAVLGERISDKGPRELGDRSCFYGVE
jgi:hypothetical protein